jgi:hypothetical protein
METVSMGVSWVELIVGFGLATVLMPWLTSYFQRKGKNLATKQDVSQITDQVEKVRLNHAQELERIRADLRALVHEHETRFSRLHAKRSEAIDGLYKRLYRVHEAFLPLVGMLKSEEDEEFQGKLEYAGETAQDMLTFFGEHRLYFPEPIVSGFGRLNNKLHTAWTTFLLQRRGPDWTTLPRPLQEEDLKMWRTARDAIVEHVPVLREEIEREMKRALGAIGDEGPKPESN